MGEHEDALARDAAVAARDAAAVLRLTSLLGDEPTVICSLLLGGTPTTPPHGSWFWDALGAEAASCTQLERSLATRLGEASCAAEREAALRAWCALAVLTRARGDGESVARAVALLAEEVEEAAGAVCTTAAAEAALACWIVCCAHAHPATPDPSSALLRCCSRALRAPPPGALSLQLVALGADAASVGESM